MNIITFYEKLKQHCKACNGSYDNCKECEMKEYCFDFAIVVPSVLEDRHLNILRQSVNYLEAVCQTEDK